MPIEFRCDQCQKLLRTSDDTAGKRAKCPECGAVTTIPMPTPPASNAASSSPFGGGAGGPVPPSPGVSPGSPFGQPQGGAGQAGNPYQSPGQYDYGPMPGPSPGFAPAGTIRPTQLEMGDVFRRQWAVFKEQGLMCLAGWMAAAGINFGVGLLVAGLEAALQAGMKDQAFLPVLGINLLQMVFNAWVSIGLALFTLRLARGQQAVFGDLFAGGPYLLRVIGGWILYSLIVLVGMILLIIPGIIFSLMFSQFYYLILDRNLSVMQSLSMSCELTKGNKLTLWAIGLVAGLLGVLFVILTCFLGAFAAFPYLLLLHPVIYLTMSGQPTAADLQYAPQQVAPQQQAAPQQL